MLRRLRQVSFSQLVVADVAVHLIFVATIEQHVWRRECLVDEDVFSKAMARICREAGGRVRTNLMIRDIDVPAPNALDGRRLEVVVDGLVVPVGPR